MDSRRFDHLTRMLVTESPTRRGALRLLAGGAVGAVLGVLQPAGTDAVHFGCRHVGRRCDRARQCCSGLCQGPRGNKTCRAHDEGTCLLVQDACGPEGDHGNGCGTGVREELGSCHCLITTGGASYCADGRYCAPCQRDKECARAYGVPGAACVACPNCPDGTMCALPCANSH